MVISTAHSTALLASPTPSVEIGVLVVEQMSLRAMRGDHLASHRTVAPSDVLALSDDLEVARITAPPVLAEHLLTISGVAPMVDHQADQGSLAVDRGGDHTMDPLHLGAILDDAVPQVEVMTPVPCC